MQTNLTRLGSLLMWATLAAIAIGQDGPFQLLPELNQFNVGPPKSEFKVSARVRLVPNSTVGMLEVTATMDESWHIYSLTQPPGGPQRTRIELQPNDDYRLLGSFAPDRPPRREFIDVFNVDGEEFAARVTWSVPIELSAGARPDSLSIRGLVRGQVCSDQGVCVPLREDEGQFEATVSGPLPAREPEALDGVKISGSHGEIRGWLSTHEAAAGDTVQLHLAVSPDQGWHVYAHAEGPIEFQVPTLIQTTLPEKWQAGAVSSSSPVETEELLPNEPPLRFHNEAVTWTIPVQIPSDAEAGDYEISGLIGLQTCASTCDPPTAMSWNSRLRVVADVGVAPRTIASIRFDDQLVTVKQGDKTIAGYDAVVQQLATSAPPAAVPSDPAASATADAPAAPTGFDPSQLKVKSDSGGLAKNLVLAFFGGFVLNFMPCVLPVIGLKIMSFVDQAGESRFRIFALNIWYTLGMLSIFLVLATLAAAPLLGLSESGIGWGQQFSYDGFNIPLICIVFTMGLSFLGVWEIPIPGFATGEKAHELSAKEGVSGAFFKGMITTILATPCGAPGLVAAYGFAVKSGSIFTAYLIFVGMGLGMAFPYLLIGAFPSLIRFLPKPGAWMDTFKQVMGFVLLGTVIFLLANVDWQNLLPTMALLFGLWFACWWIGRVPLTAEPARRYRAWAVAVIISLVAVTFSFSEGVDAFGLHLRGIRGIQQNRLSRFVDAEVSRRGGLATAADAEPAVQSENALPWEPYSPELLQELTSSQQTVMVDFTADW